MPDPFESLRQLQNTQDGAAPELGASHARARGDRLRRRRGAAQAVGSVAVVAAMIGGLSLTGHLFNRSSDTPPPATGTDGLPHALPLMTGWPKAGRDQAVDNQPPVLSFWVCGREATLESGVGHRTVGYRLTDDVRVRSVQRYATVADADQAVQDLTDAIRDCPADPAVGTALFTWTVTGDATEGIKMTRLPTSANDRPDGARTTWVVRTGSDVVVSDIQFRREAASKAESISHADRQDLKPLLRDLESS